ncbi:30S ribosomal protein S6--L-glutamate ligase [Nisaea sp.]|uniref:30S ribosomal protein S6--L-glutamate ligase n=1 Tax=Nisaea sp. TaxID=2024842 RepID=UPI003B51AC33
MKIGLLCRNPDLYSHRRIVEAAEARGHEIDIIDHLRCYIDIAANDPEVHYRGESLTGYDAIIPRIGASVTFFGTAVLRQFEMMDVYPLNESVAISRSRDKLRSMQLLSREGVGLPVTVFAHRTSHADEVIRLAGGTPVIIKLLEGTQGIGVVLAETDKSAESIIQAFGGVKTDVLVQQFVEEAKGEDIRCLVVGEKVVASMIRRGKEGDFRSNLHRGGSAEAVRISREERATALKAANAMGLNVCGVDMLRSDNGPVVMEVNSSPGLEGVEKATNVDVAGKIIEFIEKNARVGRTQTKGGKSRRRARRRA